MSKKWKSRLKRRGVPNTGAREVGSWSPDTSQALTFSWGVARQQGPGRKGPAQEASGRQGGNSTEGSAQRGNKHWAAWFTILRGPHLSWRLRSRCAEVGRHQQGAVGASHTPGPGLGHRPQKANEKSLVLHELSASVSPSLRGTQQLCLGTGRCQVEGKASPWGEPGGNLKPGT